MHFALARLLSIALIIESYVRHIRNLRPMNRDRLIYYTYSEEIQLRQCARNSIGSHCRLTPPFQRIPTNIRINLTLSESKVIELHRRR